MQEFERHSTTSRGRSSTRRPLARGRWGVPLLALVAGLVSLGCETVVQAPIGAQTAAPGGRHGDCERASEDYCQLVVGAKGKKLRSCVAEYTFECVSGPR